MMMTGEPGTSWARISVAWIPSSCGMLTSMRTTSGCNRRVSSMAFFPSAAVPQTSMSSSKLSSFWRFSRVLGMSSTIRTRIMRRLFAGVRGASGLLELCYAGSVAREELAERLAVDALVGLVGRAERGEAERRRLGTGCVGDEQRVGDRRVHRHRDGQVLVEHQRLVTDVAGGRGVGAVALGGQDVSAELRALGQVSLGDDDVDLGSSRPGAAVVVAALGHVQAEAKGGRREHQAQNHHDDAIVSLLDLGGHLG